MTDAERLSRRKGRGNIWLAVLIFFLTITVADLAVTLAAESDIRKGLQPVAQPPSLARQQNSAPQVVAKQQAQSRSPVKIKLHHSAKGDCAWDLAGENVEEILRIDRRLRKAFDPQEEAPKI